MKSCLCKLFGLSDRGLEAVVLVVLKRVSIRYFVDWASTVSLAARTQCLLLDVEIKSELA